MFNQTFPTMLWLDRNEMRMKNPDILCPAEFLTQFTRQETDPSVALRLCHGMQAALGRWEGSSGGPEWLSGAAVRAFARAQPSQGRRPCHSVRVLLREQPVDERRAWGLRCRGSVHHRGKLLGSGRIRQRPAAMGHQRRPGAQPHKDQNGPDCEQLHSVEHRSSPPQMSSVPLIAG